jgi:hypothetical protein
VRGHAISPAKRRRAQGKGILSDVKALSIFYLPTYPVTFDRRTTTPSGFASSSLVERGRSVRIAGSRRKIMKRTLTSVVFVVAFVSLLVLGLASRVQAKECSNASIKGPYVVTCEGTVVGTGPIAVVGTFIADGNGNASELETLSFNGEISQGVPFTVTYTMNADCTGTHVATGSGGVFHGNIFLANNKKEIHYISTDPDFVVLCVIRKQ